MPVKLAIYDDHLIIVTGIYMLLAGYEHMEIVGCYKDPDKLINELSVCRPDVLIALCREGDCYNNLPVQLHKRYPDLAILIIVSESSVSKLTNMFSYGRKGYLLESTCKEKLATAIKTLYGGKTYLDPSLEAKLPERKSKKPVPGLSFREYQVLRLIVDEHTNQEIASRLYISVRTVENHRCAVMQKFGVKNTAGLIRYTLQKRLVEV